MPTPVPWGDEFLVNSTAIGDQYSPTITALSDGRFVVAWDDTSWIGGDTSGFGIRARVFNADGSPAGTDFLAAWRQRSSADRRRLAALIAKRSRSGCR